MARWYWPSLGGTGSGCTEETMWRDWSRSLLQAYTSEQGNDRIREWREIVPTSDVVCRACGCGDNNWALDTLVPCSSDCRTFYPTSCSPSWQLGPAGQNGCSLGTFSGWFPVSLPFVCCFNRPLCMFLSQNDIKPTCNANWPKWTSYCVAVEIPHHCCS